MKRFKKAFTLAEGTPCFENLWRVGRRAFTLAEVLITLTIVGVVAALTIPTLLAKINEKVSENRQEVIEDRLLDGLNRYSTLEDGLSKPYETTYDFLVGLSKYYKMAQICKADEITNCIPYSEINYEENGTPASIEVKKLQKIDSFIATGKENYLPPASFITAQGTPVIMALKRDCIWDTGRAMKTVQDSGCIAYMYDESGARLPNKYGKDIVPHGLTITGQGVGTPFATIGGVKIMMKPVDIRLGITNAECEEEKAKNYGITHCINYSDYWASAMQYCHDRGWHLPSEQEANAIVHGMFKDSSGNHPSGSSWDQYTYIIDSELVSPLGIRGSNSGTLGVSADFGMVSFWLNKEVEDTDSAYYQAFSRDSTYTGDWGRGSNNSKYAFCLE